MIFKWLLFVALLLGLFSLSSCSKVVNLTAETFELFNKTEFTLVKFYTDWCNHCKLLHPKYEAAAEKLAELNYTIFQVDCDQEPEICKTYQIAGYPTLKAFYNGTFAKDYNMARETEQIVEFVKKGNMPAYTLIDTEEALADYFADKKTVGVLHVVPESHPNKSEILNRFVSIARENNHMSTFFVTHLADSKHLDPYPNKTIVINGPKVVALNLDIQKEDVVPYIYRSKLPLYGKLDENTYEMYSSAKLPIGFLFATTEEGPGFEKVMVEVAKKFSDFISIAWIDSTLYGSHSQTLGLSGDKFPCFAIHDMEKGLKFPYNETKPLDAPSITEFIESIKNGSIEAYYKSEPIPEENEAQAVRKLVYNNIHTLLNASVAVLVKFYGPWCPACNRLAPNYIALAEAFKPQADKIVFAEFDLENNDLPFEIEQTIRMIPALYLYLPQTKSYDGFVKFDEKPYKKNIAEFLVSHCKGLKSVEVSEDDHIDNEPHEDIDSGLGSDFGEDHEDADLGLGSDPGKGHDGADSGLGNDHEDEISHEDL